MSFGLPLAHLKQKTKLKFSKAQISTPKAHARASKAQAAVEYMTIASIILVTSGIIFFYAWSYSHESLAVSKSTESAETIAAAIDYVYSLGYGTQTVVDIELPKSVTSSSVAEREVVFVIHTSSGYSDIVAPTRANATGSLPAAGGRHSVIVNYTEAGVVVG